MPRKNKRPPAARQAKPDSAANLAALKRLLASPDVQKYLRLIKRLPKNLEIAGYRKRQRIILHASGTAVGIGEASARSEEARSKKKTRPPVEIPHLDEAIDQMLLEREKDHLKFRLVTAQVKRVFDIAKKEYRVLIPAEQTKTVRRRIADREKVGLAKTNDQDLSGTNFVA